MDHGLHWDERATYRDAEGTRLGAVLDDTPPDRPRPEAPWSAIVGHRSVGRHRTVEEAMVHVEQVCQERAEALRAANKR